MRLGQCIAVVSGKGGTGKTSFAAGVGTALALRKQRVLCLDCDTALRNLDLALGLPPQGRQTEGPRPGAWGLQGAERPAAAPPEGWGHAAAKKGEGPANLPDQGGATAQGRLE